jgi:hypothetical protein
MYPSVRVRLAERLAFDLRRPTGGLWRVAFSR